MMNKQTCRVAVIGAGRMGSVVAKQLPDFADKLVIDLDEEKAKWCAETIGGTYATEFSAAKDADLVALVLPGPVIQSAAAQLAGVMKNGAILMNMATAGVLEQSFRDAFPSLHMIDCKIVGNAAAMSESNAPCAVIVDTMDEELFQRIAAILPGYAKVIRGDAGLVPALNGIATKEALRCGFRIRSLLEPYHLPDDMVQILMYTVAGGTLQSQAMGTLGGYAQMLAQELRDEGAV